MQQRPSGVDGMRQPMAGPMRPSPTFYGGTPSGPINYALPPTSHSSHGGPAPYPFPGPVDLSRRRREDGMMGVPHPEAFHSFAPPPSPHLYGQQSCAPLAHPPPQSHNAAAMAAAAAAAAAAVAAMGVYPPPGFASMAAAEAMMHAQHGYESGEQSPSLGYPGAPFGLMPTPPLPHMPTPPPQNPAMLAAHASYAHGEHTFAYASFPPTPSPTPSPVFSSTSVSLGPAPEQLSLASLGASRAEKPLVGHEMQQAQNVVIFQHKRGGDAGSEGKSESRLYTCWRRQDSSAASDSTTPTEVVSQTNGGEPQPFPGAAGASALYEVSSASVAAANTKASTGSAPFNFDDMGQEVAALEAICDSVLCTPVKLRYEKPITLTPGHQDLTMAPIPVQFTSPPTFFATTVKGRMGPVESIPFADIIDGQVPYIPQALQGLADGGLLEACKRKKA